MNVPSDGTNACPVGGDATDPHRITTNRMKNRSGVPTYAAFDTSITVNKLLHSRDSVNAFDENKAASITGYIVDAKAEGPESCNCHSSDPADHDIHIYIAPNASTSSLAECVVVEVTPWGKKLHPGWTIDFLNSLKRHRVTISGWLLYDWEHLG